MARLHHALFTGVGRNTGFVPAVAQYGGIGMAVGGLQNADSSAAMNLSMIGQYLILSGASHPANNGTFLVIALSSQFEAIVYNPSAIVEDPGTITWQFAFNPPAGIEGPVLLRACGGGGGGGGSGGTSGLTNKAASGGGGAGAILTHWTFDASSAALVGNAAQVTVAGPTVTVTGLTNMTPSCVGYNLTLQDSSVSANVGTWTIASYISATSVTITNGSAATDTGGDSWYVGIIPGVAYPVAVGAGGTAGTAGTNAPTDGGNGGVGGNTTFGGNIVGYGAMGGVGGGDDTHGGNIYSSGGAAGIYGAQTLSFTATGPAVPPAGPWPMPWTPPGCGGLGSNDTTNFGTLGAGAILTIGGGQPGAPGGDPGSAFAANGGGGGGGGAPGSTGGEGGRGGEPGGSPTPLPGNAGTGFGAGGGGAGGSQSNSSRAAGYAGGSGTNGMCEAIWTS